MISRGRAATVGLVSAGLVLRLLQLLNGRSLWKDEASLAVSIVERSLVQLVTTPLDYNQVAAPLYLVLANSSTVLLGSSEFALRLPAFLCSAASLLLFVVLARQVAEGAALYAALAMIASSPLLVEYAGEAKPYSADALGSLAVVLCAMHILKLPLTRRDAVVAGIVGVSASLLSLGAILVVAGAIVTLVLFRPRPRVIGVCGAWIGGILLTLWWTSHYTASDTRRVMQQFWEFAFMPFPPRSLYDAAWLWRALTEINSAGLGIRLVPWLLIIAAVAGAIALRRRKGTAILTLLISPVVVLILCSGLRLYPMNGRLTLFILPSLALLSATGIALVLTRVPAQTRPGFWAVFVLLIFPRFSLLSGEAPVSRIEEMKPVVAHVAENRQSADGIYVFYAATPAMRYYASRFGIERSAWVGGGANWGNIDAYLRELDTLRERSRLWVIFSHDVIPGERAAILTHLDSLSARVVEKSFPPAWAASARSAVFLYDRNRSDSRIHDESVIKR